MNIVTGDKRRGTLASSAFIGTYIQYVTTIANNAPNSGMNDTIGRLVSLFERMSIDADAGHFERITDGATATDVNGDALTAFDANLYILANAGGKPELVTVTLTDITISVSKSTLTSLITTALGKVCSESVTGFFIRGVNLNLK